MYWNYFKCLTHFTISFCYQLYIQGAAKKFPKCNVLLKRNMIQNCVTMCWGKPHVFKLYFSYEAMFVVFTISGMPDCENEFSQV